MHGCEAMLADHLAAVLDAARAASRSGVPPAPTAIPAVTVPAPDLAGYDALLRVPVLREAE